MAGVNWYPGMKDNAMPARECQAFAKCTSTSFATTTPTRPALAGHLATQVRMPRWSSSAPALDRTAIQRKLAAID
jgi:hypothetical protein